MSRFLVTALRTAGHGFAALAVVACSHNPSISPDAQQITDAPLGDVAADAPFGSNVLDLSGDLSVHDPAILAANGKFFLYSTGQGLRVHESTDLLNWKLDSPVFVEKPAWITTTDPKDPTTLWAPDLSYFGDNYHLYYAASSFGSQHSCIGHAISPTLDPPAWVDDGAAVICSTTNDPQDYNAIDPAAVVDQSGNMWLALGSFWSGLKLIQLTPDGHRAGTDFTALATRANTAVEAPYLIHHGDFYYLFASVDFCCQGVNSTYKIMVGRAANITGPYVDKSDTPLMTGGGTLILQSGSRWKGPGHNAILHTASGDYNIYHSYDAATNGAATLRIAEIRWTDDGWPVSAGP
jgi:arabinan endo-1,5-alpha-L-arabinosidase